MLSSCVNNESLDVKIIVCLWSVIIRVIIACVASVSVGFRGQEIPREKNVKMSINARMLNNTKMNVILS